MFKTKMATALGALALAFSAASVSPAQAGGLPADRPSMKDTGYAAPAPLWSGLYLGVHGGYAGGEYDGTLTIDGGGAGFPNPDQIVEGDGLIGGGQLGYNFQSGSLVFGLEGDLSYSSFEGSETFDTIVFGGFGSVAKDHEFDIEYFGTLRGRLGYASGTMLAYVTGGFAWAESEAHLTTVVENRPSGAPSAIDSESSADATHTGWTIGAGVEKAFGHRWTLRAEYLYVDLGAEDYDFSGTKFNLNTGAPIATQPVDNFDDAELQFDVVRVGLNYKLTGARESLEPLK